MPLPINDVKKKHFTSYFSTAEQRLVPVNDNFGLYAPDALH